MLVMNVCRLSLRLSLRRLPVRAQFFVELCPAFFGKEDSGAL
jgi:hypothetical protein